MLKSFLVESDGLEGIEYSVMTALIVSTVLFPLTLMTFTMHETFLSVANIILN